MAWPFSRTVPLVGTRSPDSSRIRVDLPAPFGPTMATVSPAVTDSDTPSSSVAPRIRALTAASS